MARGTVMTRLLVRDFGTALKFPGSGSCSVGNPTGIPNTNAPLSFSIWLKLTTYGGSPNIATLYNGSNAGVALVATGSTVAITKSGGGNLVSLLAAPPIGVWHHYTYTFDGTTHTIYQDGISNNTSTTAADNSIVTNIRVSTYNGANGPYTGLADDFCIWNRCITAAEVTQNYSTGVAPSSGIVLRWLFNEGSGSSAIDSSGNSNTGSISGATYSTDVVMKARTAA